MAASKREHFTTADGLGVAVDLPGRRLESGEVVAGKYEIRSLLGVGGMGCVYVARHVLSGRRVALKWIDPQTAAATGLLERFVRETQAMGRIDHPNVVGVFDAGVDEDAAYLTMELLRGEPLRELIDERAPLDPEEAIGLMMPAFEGVAAAHAVGVIHRDIKPENLFVVRSSDGEVQTTKVLDFGISKFREARAGVPEVTVAGSVIGTPHYMSPEQARGREIDRGTDVWALGVVLFELLAGAPPFDGGSHSELIIEIATGPTPQLSSVVPGIAPGLSMVLERALAKSPDDRWSSVAELARALEPFAGRARFHPPIVSASDFPPAMRTGAGSSGSDARNPPVSGMRVAPEASTMPARPSSISAEEDAVPSRSFFWPAIAVLVTVSLGAAGMLFQKESDVDPSTPLAGEALSEATPEVAPVELLPEQPGPEPVPPAGVAVEEPLAPSDPLTVTEIARPRPRREHSTRTSPRPRRPVTPTSTPTRARSGTLSREEF